VVYCRSRREKIRLETDYYKLQESYHELEQLKDRLEDRELIWQLNLTDSQKESDQCKGEVKVSIKSSLTSHHKYTSHITMTSLFISLMRGWLVLTKWWHYFELIAGFNSNETYLFSILILTFNCGSVESSGYYRL